MKHAKSSSYIIYDLNVMVREALTLDHQKFTEKLKTCNFQAISNTHLRHVYARSLYILKAATTIHFRSCIDQPLRISS